ncbi:MAG: pilus assembly PilX N-terminal domain-containing protein [Candidatus Pacebacteria bacterium]|nr:pilus assembly PilX N-terminal domain-containing protein [Candidatus Paceibacterota bacterium]
MNLKKNDKNSGEIILFVVFVILFFMLFIGLFLSKMILRQTRVANNVANSVQAYYIADTGAEVTLYSIRNELSSGAFTYGNTIANVEISGGKYIATVTSTSLDDLSIEVIGIYNQTSRAIELSWG